jgi:hypothetical protein
MRGGTTYLERLMPMTALPLDALVAAFRDETLPRGEWTHAAHLRVGAWHVHHHGAGTTLALLRARITRLNERHGTVNSDTSGYHETITVAYVKLIEAFLATFAPEVALEARVEALLAGPLGDRALLFRFWSRETLLSAAARRGWVPPDLAPLSVPAPRSP